MRRTANRTAGRQLTEIVKAIENRTVLAYIEALQLFEIVVHILWRDHLQELHIIVGVEFCHVSFSRWLRPLSSNPNEFSVRRTHAGRR